jgi:hypothetical protein
MTLVEIARALGGEVSRDQVLAPGPSHSRVDRSLSVKLSASSPDGFLCHSFSGDDWRLCRDHVREQLGFDATWHGANLETKCRHSTPETPRRREASSEGQREDTRAFWLWQQRQSIAGSPAERYLREARGYAGPLPATLGYLPARGEHSHAMIAAFGVATEPEPGVLRIADTDVRGVHLTRLRPDGVGKTEGTAKIMVGTSSKGSPIVVAAPNDLLGLVITEGIEEALSAHVATGLGAWAAGSCGRMPALADVAPSYIEAVTILADPGAGTASAYKLQNALVALCIGAVVSHLVSEASAA